MGPSLPLSQARNILPDGIYLPPARQADVLSAVTTHQPDVIGLIDGVIGQSLSVWHIEILYALESGVLVYGASSMGALRAAETSSFGMVGIGKVYQMYAVRELNDDDEVALVHGPADADYYAMSEPMVNLRMTFKHAQEKGVIDALTCEKLTAVAKSLYYPDRKFSLIFEKARAEGVQNEILSRMETFVAEHYVNVKAQDAVLLLERIRDLPEPLPRTQNEFALTRSHLFEALYQRDRTVQHRDTGVSLESIASYIALHKGDFNSVNFSGMNRMLAVVLADILEVEVSEEDVDKEVKRFCLRHRLTKDGSLANWLKRNDLFKGEFRELMRQITLCRRLHRWFLTRNGMVGNVKILLDELRLRNDYEEWAGKAASQKKALEEEHDDSVQISHDDARMRELIIDHLRETDCRMDTNFQEWSSDAGFLNPIDLKYELIRSRRERTVRKQEIARLFGDSPR